MTRYARRSNGEGVVCDASSEIGSGGEARIYEVASAVDLVAKVYHTPTQLHANKLLSMLANPPDGVISASNQSSIAWPVDLLVVPDGSQRIAGFLMPRVKMEPIIEFYHPKTRLKKHSLFHYRYLHRTGRNLAAAVGTAHANGYIIGDVNESNILVNEQALVSLVDTDSFQVRDQSSGLIYRCPVGKIEFTPPELQGQDFSEIDRSPHHDAFGLAVLLFQLLMEGTHPFAGRFTGTGEAPSLGRRIKAGHFPYGSGRHSYSPGKHALPFSVLDPSLQALFLLCFEEGYQNPHRRPDAVMWRDALQNAEASLTSCRKNSQHLFGSHLSVCPWCDRSVQQNNIDSFPSSVQQSLPIAPTQQPRVALDPVPVIAFVPQLHPQRSQQPKKRQLSLGQGLWKTFQFVFSCILLAALAQWMYHEVMPVKVASLYSPPANTSYVPSRPEVKPVPDQTAPYNNTSLSVSHNFIIVPGHSVANVSLGSNIEAVQKMLGDPTTSTVYADGIIQNSYTNPEVGVTFRNRRTIEISVTDPKCATAEGISINSSFSQIGEKFKSLQCNRFSAGDGSGAGAVIYNYTDLARGITFSLGVQDDLLPSYKPDVITIEKPGQQLITNDTGWVTYEPEKTPLQKDEFGYH